MSTLDPRHLPEDRLATTDQDGSRIWIVPARVRGIWKTRKTYFHLFLLLLFVLTPWLRYQGSPLLLFDIFNRQFVFFGNVFGAHDGPLLFFVLGILGFSLIIATALWGRVWCGWACPQTVFIEQVFRRIETWIVGNRAQQLDCHKNPWKLQNVRKNITKWSVFIIVSVFLAHTFIAYFVSWERLLDMMTRPPGESWTVFLFVFIIAAIVLFDFAWFREQFCIIMCPYGRFQSVLMDQNSLTVAYDYTRGEPRVPNAKKVTPEQGDCIDCFKCVSVCPTGIDIRNGTQLECIACTACIDACDEVMEKIGRPKGLVRYAAESDFTREQGRRWFRPRLVLYIFILLALAGGLIYSVKNHQSFYVSYLRQSQKPYVVNGDQLMNNYRVHLKNSAFQAVDYEIRLVESKGSEAPSLRLQPELIQGRLGPNESIHRPFFILAQPWQVGEPSPQLYMILRYKMGSDWLETVDKINMVGPRAQ
jgi:cytochrome c oxidase accessory protein FixG